MGKKAELKKEDLDKIKCLKDEKQKLKEKAQKKDGQLMRYLRAEIEREKKIKMFKKKQEENEKNLKIFNKLKNKEIKLIENDRYKDNQNIYERQKLMQKYFSSNEIDNNSKDKNNLNKSENNKENNKNLTKEKSQSKMETLKKQIKDYEKKSEEYKKKIENMFELKDKEEIKKLVKTKNYQDDNSKKLKSTELMKQKMNKLEEKFEIEKYRRETALMKSMDLYQNKINKILLYQEGKEEKIKKALLENEKKREEKIDKRNEIIDKTKKNKIINERNNGSS